MKQNQNKIIILVLLAIMVTSSKAQNFIDTSKIWTVQVKYDFYQPEKVTMFIKFEDDTLINGLNYTKMYYSIDDRSFSEKKLIYYWIEKENGEIYSRFYQSSNDLLIYDFNLLPGDTSNHADINDRIVLDSIITKDFGTEKRKFFYSHYLTDTLWNVEWIEGVGSLFSPFMSDEKGYSGSINTLICFEEQNERIYLNPNFTDCDASTGTDVNTIYIRENLIECYCEPGGSIKITNISNDIGTFYLYDLNGCLLTKNQINTYETNICPPGTGILLYKFVTESGKNQTGKIMLY